MISFLLKRPVAVLMTACVLLTLGILSVFSIPTSLMPKIDIPQITVQVTDENISARQLEKTISSVLKDELLQIDDLDEIKINTRDGFTSLELIFSYGTNISYAFLEVNEKIDQSINLLPRTTQRPRVIKASITDIPIINLNLSFKDENSENDFFDLSLFAESILKKRIEQLPEVALADMSGIMKSEVVISPYREKMERLGVSITSLKQAIRNNNIEYSSLLIKNGVYEYTVNLPRSLNSLEDINNIFFNVNGRTLQIKEIASVRFKPKEGEGRVYINNQRAITFAIVKKADAKIGNLKKSIEDLTSSLVNEYDDLKFSINQDQSKLLRITISNLISSLCVGVILAIFIMLIFIKDGPSSLVIAISVPASILLSVFVMFLADLSINLISLSGLIFGVGMMIDNSIIVIDNINQKLITASTIDKACELGASELISPLISSVLTTCSVFLPLIFLSGLTGALFFDQAITISISLLSSLIVSIVLVPVIYRKLRMNSKADLKNVETSFYVLVYKKGYVYFFKNRWLMFLLCIICLLLSIGLINILQYSKLPEISRDDMVLDIKWNENINIEENERRTLELTNSINKQSLSFCKIGRQQYIIQPSNRMTTSHSSIYFKTDKVEDVNELEKVIDKYFQNKYPRTSYKISDPKNVFNYIFGENSSSIFARLYYRENNPKAEGSEIQRINDILKSYSKTKLPLVDKIQIHVDMEKLLLYNVSYIDLIKELETAFNGHFIDDLKSSSKATPIFLKYNLTEFDNIISQVSVTTLPSKDDTELYQIPLRYLVKVEEKTFLNEILSDRLGEYLEFELKNKSNINDVVRILKDTGIDKRYFVKFSGESFDFKSINENLVVLVILSLLILYLILVAQFESFWQPLIILIEIPIDLAGSLLLLWIFNESLNVMSIIGIVVMSGIIINDSILKIHTINSFLRNGINLNDAVSKASSIRLKPILMTSLTTILALIPFLFIDGLGSDLQRPLALSVIGGMLIGTIMSIYLIPVLFVSFYREKE